MKKILTAITIVAMLSITSSAMATVKAKIPKTMCLVFDSYSDYQQLSLKAIGGLTDSWTGKKLKTYAITGTAFNGYYGPVSGSAYVIPESTILHISYGGTFGGFTPFIAGYELYMDLASGIGTWHYVYYGSTFNTFSDTARMTDCTFFDVPGDAKEGAVYSTTPTKQ